VVVLNFQISQGSVATYSGEVEISTVVHRQFPCECQWKNFENWSTFCWSYDQNQVYLFFHGKIYWYCNGHAIKCSLQCS